MSDQALVSIIIPTYNRAHLIGETLDSVIAQTYQNWECIIVDDGSSDNTDEVIGEYVQTDSRFKYYHRPDEHLPGGNGARNYGFKMSRGEYVNWFDSDDIMLPEMIEFQLNTLYRNNKKIVISLLDRYNEDLSKLIKPAENHLIKYSIYYDYALRIMKAHLPTTFFDRTIVNKYKLNEELKKSQEVEFMQRIFREEEDEIVLSNKMIVNIRRHSKSITGNLNKATLTDQLKVKLILIKELPNNAPLQIQNLLHYSFLKNLKLAYLNKFTSIYFYFLFSLRLKIRVITYKLAALYLLNYFLNRGENKYNIIISEYSIK
jgi:glycosyltransferase involved in cell wall biosynthesis